MVTRWADRAGEEIQPASWAECSNTLLSSGGGDALYRGHRCFDWELQSSLERALLDHADRWDKHRHGLLLSMAGDPDTENWTRAVEDALTQRFRQRAMHFGIPELPKAWDIVGWWEVMQHHGAPTRLLDWTMSPFTALWFAVNGHDDARDGDMALWVYDRQIARLNLQDTIQKLKSTDDYRELDDRELQNRLVTHALRDGKEVLIPVRPASSREQSLSRASSLSAPISVSHGLPATGSGRDWQLGFA